MICYLIVKSGDVLKYEGVWIRCLSLVDLQEWLFICYLGLPDSIISHMFMYIMENMKHLSVLMVSCWQAPFQENSLRLLLAG